MKNISFLFLLLISFSVTGQKISFSQQIVSSQDEQIIAIQAQWKSYIQDCLKSYIKKDNNLIAKYWNDEELEDGFSNLAMHQVFPTIPVCLIGETVTYDITKLDNGYYRIKNLILQSDSLSKSVPVIFSIYAKPEDSGIKFYSHFFLAKTTLNHYHTENIEYFYPSNYDFDKSLTKETEGFYAQLINNYGIQPIHKIKYIVANNLDDANSYLGFDYSVRSSVSKDAGYYLTEQNIIVSCKVDHFHELVHSVFMTKFPDAATLFQEGIATYLAGSQSEKIEFHITQLVEIVNSNPEADLSQFSNWNKIIGNKTNPFYTIGASFIDYAFKTGGFQKVLSLFKYPNSIDGTYSAIKNELGIDKDNINSFIKNYINNLNDKIY